MSLCNSTVRAKRLLCRPERYDMLLIGHAVPQRQRDWLLGYARETSPETRILSLSDGITPEDVSSAGSNSERILMTVRRLASEVLTSEEMDFMSAARLPRRAIKTLYVATGESVAVLRKHQLQAEGYCVEAAVSVQEVELACERNAFHLVIVSPAIGPRVKLRIACAVRQRVPAAQILETGTAVPFVDGAVSTLGVTGPELSKAIESVLRSNWNGISVTVPKALEIN